MAITPRTVEDASKYILDSIEEWKKTGQDKKIISLSNWAEKWRIKTGGEAANMKQIFKNIRDLRRIIQRSKNIYPVVDTAVLEREEEILKKVYADYIRKRNERKAKNNIKIELPKIEEGQIRDT